MNNTMIALAAFAAAAAAQTPAEITPGIGQTFKQNAEALRQYSYKRRTAVTIKGQARGARVDLVRYVDGKKETVPLETPQQGQGGGGGRAGGLRGRMMQKKKEEMKEDVQRLDNLLQRYISPDHDSMRTALERAAISKTGPEPGADVKVVATGLVVPSDSFTLTWSVVNKRPEKIEIRTELDGKPVTATLEYAALPDGLFYAARTIVSDPKEDISVNIDSFDFTRGGDPQ